VENAKRAGELFGPFPLTGHNYEAATRSRARDDGMAAEQRMIEGAVRKIVDQFFAAAEELKKE
jgi:hypothetical protein